MTSTGSSSELCTPDMHVENRSRSAIPDRSAEDLIASFKELQAMASSHADVDLCCSSGCRRP